MTTKTCDRSWWTRRRLKRTKSEGGNGRQEAVVMWPHAPTPILGSGIQKQLELKQLQGWGGVGADTPCRLILDLGNERVVQCPRWRLSKGHGIKSGQDEWWRRYSETSWSLVRLPGTAGHPFCPFDGFLVGFPVFFLGKLVYLLNALQGSFCFLL